MTLAFTEALAEVLARRTATPLQPDLAIAQWRLTVDAGTSVDIGLKDNHMGGPYEAPNELTALRGSAYVVWADGRVSTGVIDRATLEELDEDLHTWRQAAYHDPWAPDVPGASVEVPPVALYDEGAAAWVRGDTGVMFEILARFAAELPPYEAERVSGGVTAARSERTILSSRGFRHAGRSTGVSAWAEVDGRASDGLSLRRLPDPAEIDGIIRRVGETSRALRRDARLTPGRQRVVLWPSAAEALWSKYVLGNLEGQRVLAGGSAFGLEQFADAAALFHPSLSFGIDPLRPLGAGSYDVSGEGVPACAFTFIDEGHLVSPLLDLKHARKAGLAPTPWPRGASSHVLPPATLGFDDLVASLDRGLLVYQILGLHTQDGASGRFSLTVSQGLVVERGRVVGRAKAIIAGNFLDVLREPVTWAFVPGKEGRVLAFDADVLPG